MSAREYDHMITGGLTGQDLEDAIKLIRTIPPEIPAVYKYSATELIEMIDIQFKHMKKDF